MATEPRRRVQFERKPSTRYARRQSHLHREPQHPPHQLINTAGLAGPPATRSIADIINEYSSKHEETAPRWQTAPPAPRPPPRSAPPPREPPSQLPDPPVGPAPAKPARSPPGALQLQPSHPPGPPTEEVEQPNIDPGIDYLKWVSEVRQPSKLSPSDSCSSGQSGSSFRSSEESAAGGPGRTASPDSGCEVSVLAADRPRDTAGHLITYTSEPKVRRPEEGGNSGPVPAPRPSRTVQVTTIEHPPLLEVKPALDCAYSRAGIYSLEGSRLAGLERPGSEAEQDSGRGSSIQSGEPEPCSAAAIRSYASSRDILQLYGAPGQPAAQPLAPRLTGFSSSDLRLPPSAMLLSLSGQPRY